MKALLLFAVIDDDIEAAGHGDQELMTFFQRMPGAVSPARDVVEIENAFDTERNMAVSLEKSQIAAGIVYFGEVNDFTLAQLHSW
jgi:hypothetical protein